jgi:hypothetical protein
MRRTPFLLHLFLLGLSLVIYIIALSLPSLEFGYISRNTTYINGISDTYIMRGIEVTAWGVLGLLFLQVPAIGWLANPLYWLSCILLAQKKYKSSLAAAFISVILGFTGTIAAHWLPLPNGSNPYSQMLLIKLLPGFWLWLAAPICIIITSIFRLNWS